MICELTKEDELQLIGQQLLKRGFKTWFLFFFKAIENKPFDFELIHQDLFDVFEKIYNQETTRQIINISPRSAKTTIAIYFVAYCLAINPACQFIYTSYSQDLLSDNARRLASVLSSDIYKKMYLVNSIEEEQKLNVVDEFWLDLLKKDNEFKITSRKITTKAGGVVLFASVGSQITGFGFGDKNRKGFNGCLIVDDGDKPSTIRSKKVREKTHQYYAETLLTRANNSLAPIVNIQQRLHIDDLTAFLTKTYKFNILKKPLIENGVIQLAKQYTPERIEELKKNNYTWASQYMQDPVAEGGNIIKSEYFSRFNQEPDGFNYVYIVCDTAYSDKTTADNSVFSLWSLKGKDLYLLDLYKNKIDFPTLKRELKNFYAKCKSKFSILSTIYIEDKASGQSLLQELKDFGLPVRPIYPTITEKEKEVIKNKYWRCQEVLSDIMDGFVYIPEYSNWVLDFIEEVESFSGDDSTHDDQVDCLLYALKIRRNLITKRVDWSKASYEIQRYF